jgi:glycosyltransferase involved in cell wall biosynthesis
VDAEAQALEWPRVCLVGPLPPPAGGMANQCDQLARLLEAEGLSIEVVRTNAPYRPQWVGRLPFLRALFRLVPFAWNVWRAAGRSQVMHLLANSGWAWHLVAAPAMFAARLRQIGLIVNYRGGAADAFFSSTRRRVVRSLRKAELRVTPTTYLQRVFAKHGLDADIIPNIVDLSRFRPRRDRRHGDSHNVLVARNLEPIYGIDTALRAFARIRQRFPAATLTVCGSGPELASLQTLAASLAVAEAVEFTGRVDNAAMPALYGRAACALNPSTVDNMPISILEAYASGVPVVSTDAGGVPDILRHGVSGLLVPVGDDVAMAAEVCRVLEDERLCDALIGGGLKEAERCAWLSVRALWHSAYRRAAAKAGQA